MKHIYQPVIPAFLKPESSLTNKFWMPDQVRHDNRQTIMERDLYY